MTLIRIDDETTSAEDFIRFLKLNDRFTNLVTDFITEEVTARSADKLGISVTTEEVQERVDVFRRLQGLHRARDTMAYLEQMGVSLEDFERHMTDEIRKEKMFDTITTPAAVEEYFRLHSPRFDSVDLSHMLVESEGKARELASMLEDDPDMFAELAREHSVAESGASGGAVGVVLRGQLADQIEAKVFNADADAVLGPYPTADELFFDIYRVNAKRDASLDEETGDKVKKMLFDEWLASRFQEHRIEVQ